MVSLLILTDFCESDEAGDIAPLRHSAKHHQIGNPLSPLNIP